MTRVISGVALAAAALAAILFLPVVALRGVACTVAALAAHEYVRVADSAGGVSRWLLIVAVVAACWLASTGFGVDLLVVFLVALAWVGAEVLFLGRTIQQAGAAMIAPLYIGVPLGMLAGIQMLGGWPATVLLIATIVVSDSAQYYSGRQFGRRPLAPTISPKKTVEGAIGGVVLGTVFMLLVGVRVFPTAPSWALVWLGAVVVLLGICGDLFESTLKRAAGLKDSSALIPGHGGVLDRIDALLFATPAFYTYVRIVT